MNMLRSAGRYCFHLAALFGAIIVGALATKYLAAIPGLPPDSKVMLRSWLSVPPYPIHLLCALLLGFAIVREFRQREGIWVSVVPTLWFAIGIISLDRGPDSVLEAAPGIPWDVFFRRNLNIADMRTAYYPFAFTLPFLVSIAYSVGAFFGMKNPARAHPIPEDPMTGENLEP